MSVGLPGLPRCLLLGSGSGAVQDHNMSPTTAWYLSRPHVSRVSPAADAVCVALPDDALGV
jgi:hypothetical protein